MTTELFHCGVYFVFVSFQGVHDEVIMSDSFQIVTMSHKLLEVCFGKKICTT